MKKISILIIAMFSAVTLFAQSETKKEVKKTSMSSDNSHSIGLYCRVDNKKNRFADNTYLNVMATWGFNVDRKLNYHYHGFGTSFQYGKWIKPNFAMQLNNGYVFRTDGNVNSISLDFMMNLSNLIKDKENRAFSVMPFAGINTNFSNSRYGSKYKIFPGIDVGVQLNYAVSQRVSLILEGRTSASTEVTAGNNRIANFSAVKFGFSYKFNNSKCKPAHKKASTYSPVASTPITDTKSATASSEEINAHEVEKQKLIDEIADLNKKLSEKERQNAQLKTEVAQSVGKEEVTPAPVFFNIGESTPDEASIEMLKYTAETIKDNPETTYTIEGYADAKTGSIKFNQDLSEKRAQAIVKALVEKYNIDSNQLKAIGKGGIETLSDKAIYNRCVIIKDN